MLIAEDLLLLLTDDLTGKLAVSSNQVDVALGGAVLLELALAHRLDVVGESEAVRKGRLVVTDASPTSDALLDEALATLGMKQGKKPKDVVTALGKGLRDRLHARLADRGLLRQASGKILGSFPTRNWPANDTAHENAVRARLVHALRVGATDDLRVAASSPCSTHEDGREGRRPPTVGVTEKELKANAKHIAEGNWASEAVRTAIDEMMAAVVAATSSTAVTAGN